MSKERLSQIKHSYPASIIERLSGVDTLIMDRKDVDWLIEQAEFKLGDDKKAVALQEFLQKQDLAFEKLGYHVIDVAIHVMTKQAERIKELEEKEVRYREALEYYADYDANWHDDGINEVVPGVIAREALEVEGLCPDEE